MARKAKINTQSQTTSYTSRHFNPVAYFWFNRDQLPFFLSMIDLMWLDPQVRYAVNISNAPFQSAEVSVTSPDEEVAKFVLEQFDRIWATSHDKILRAKIYGFGGYEVIYKDNKGRWEFAHLKDFHPRDVYPLLLPDSHEFSGTRIGMRIKHVEDDLAGYVDLQYPNYLWLSYNSKYGSNFGESCLSTAYTPWKSKCLEGGAQTLLKTFMFKHSLVGMKVRYPEGRKIRLPDGSEVSGRDLAREIMDLAQYGSCFALPSNQTEGKYDFDIEPPLNISGDTQLLEWIDSLDKTILKAITIPQEIVEAGGTGSGYAGRSFPMSVFLLARDVEFTNYVREINQQIIYPLVCFNFGKERADYDIEPKSFLETFGEAIGGDDKDKLGDKPDGGDDDNLDFDDGDFPSDDQPDDPDSRRNNFQFSTATESQSTSKGKWITIGAKTGEDGERHGGVPVKVDGRGRIIAGPKQFVGRNIKKLKKPEAKDNPRKAQSLRKDGSQRSEKTGTVEQYQTNLAKAARMFKVPKQEVHEVAKDIWKERKQIIEERETAKNRIRELSGMTQRDIQRLENSGKDHTAVKGFDAMARQIAGEHPELGIGRGYGEGGYDDTDYASQVWDILREGKRLPPPKHDEGILKDAAEIVRANKDYAKKYGSMDDVPFAVQFAAEHAPAGGVTVQGKFYNGGEFIPGEVIAKATAEEKEAIQGKKKKQKGMFDEDEEAFQLEREPEKKTVSDTFDNQEKTKQKKLLDGLDALPGQQDLFTDEPEEATGPKSQNFQQYLDATKTADPGADHGILSPNGTISKAKRARIDSSRDTQFEKFREAQREFQRQVDAGEVTDPTGEFKPRTKPEGHPYQWQADYMLRKAKEFNELAERGMKPRTYKKEALKMEEAAKRILESTGGPDDLKVDGNEVRLNGERVGVFTEPPTKEKLKQFWESLVREKNKQPVQFATEAEPSKDREDPNDMGGQIGASIGNVVRRRLNQLLKKK